MKKSIILAVIATAMVLVSCHQPTEEEQREMKIRKSVIAYIESVSPYPDGIEITEIKVDTLTSNHNTALFLSRLRGMGISPDILSAIDREIGQGIAKADTLRTLNDTTIADVFYCGASVLARHKDDKGNPTVDLYIVPIWGGEVGEVKLATSLDTKDEYLEHLLPPEICSVMKASFLLNELVKYLY